jgi:hypothetical protein
MPMLTFARIFGFVVVATQILAAPLASATDFFVFKAGVSLKATMIVQQPSQATDLFIVRKVGPKELVNLALGRPLGSKVDSKTEILGFAVTFAEDAQLSKLIVFDPTQNGIAQVKATVAHLTALDFAPGFKTSSIAGAGIATIAIDATTLGNPAQNGLLASTLNGAGLASGPFGFGTITKGSGKGIVTGRLRFNVSDGGRSPFDGYVTEGKVKGSGKPIGTFVE